MHIKHTVHTDVLVVGSGLSGIRVTKELAEKGHEVMMVTKTHLASGSSFFPLKASLGTQVTRDIADRKVFYKDIERMSRGMHDRKLAETYIDEIPEAVSEYGDVGVKANKLEDERKACFAEHPRDIYLLQDWNETRKNVEQIFEKFDSIELMTKTVVVTLIVNNGRVSGAVLIDHNNDFVHVSCSAVILCTGGFGNIYKHNLNPNDVDGSGHILALDAGAELVNMEFIQFIPGITTPKYKTLFGEHTLEYCKDIVDDSGASIIDSWLPAGISRSELMSIRSTHGPFTHTLKSRYFDISMMQKIIEEKKEDGFKLIFDENLYKTGDQFYSVYLDWLKQQGIDMVEDDIKIAPFAHASNGGVSIDVNGCTGVGGLYAIGELSCNVEGANRLGGNSTGACMVFGKRAGLHCNEYLKSSSVSSSILEAESALLSFCHIDELHEFSEEGLRSNQVIKEIQEIMWYHANVVRSEEGLKTALLKVNDLSSNFTAASILESKNKKSAVKAMNFLRLSEILLNTMLRRRESRGAHYRMDYPCESKEYRYKTKVKFSETSTVTYRFTE
ncbi:FAD-binding protein [Salinicoccus sp. RF5]|uniref:FAD-binding protein n=1 Tax=Salinicoccus sp. RF5 TaxID=2748874 RepID=UPI001E4D3B6E|nr:FAD-binding protein [Salinicoccus sp. RF5]MCC4722307.1 FAD-binding protein [Salinicoccus sp. RF5]